MFAGNMQVTCCTERTFSELLNAYAHNCIYETKHLQEKSTEIELLISLSSDICEMELCLRNDGLPNNF